MARKPASTPPAKPKKACVPKLTEEARHFIVVQLACYRRLEAIRKEVSQRFGIDVTIQAINRYDPTTINSAPKKYEDLFMSARKAYLEEVQALPLAYQAHRLALLQEAVDLSLKAMDSEDAEVALSGAEQLRKTVESASKELGGVFTNMRKGSLELSGSVAITPDEKRNVLEDKLREIIEGRFTELKPAKKASKD